MLWDGVQPSLSPPQKILHPPSLSTPIPPRRLPPPPVSPGSPPPPTRVTGRSAPLQSLGAPPHHSPCLAGDSPQTPGGVQYPSPPIPMTAPPSVLVPPSAPNPLRDPPHTPGDPLPPNPREPPPTPESTHSRPAPPLFQDPLPPTPSHPGVTSPHGPVRVAVSPPPPPRLDPRAGGAALTATARGRCGAGRAGARGTTGAVVRSDGVPLHAGSRSLWQQIFPRHTPKRAGPHRYAHP